MTAPKYAKTLKKYEKAHNAHSTAMTSAIAPSAGESSAGSSLWSQPVGVVTPFPMGGSVGLKSDRCFHQRPTALRRTDLGRSD